MKEKEDQKIKDAESIKQALVAKGSVSSNNEAEARLAKIQEMLKNIPSFSKEILSDKRRNIEA